MNKLIKNKKNDEIYKDELIVLDNYVQKQNFLLIF